MRSGPAAEFGLKRRTACNTSFSLTSGSQGCAGGEGLYGYVGEGVQLAELVNCSRVIGLCDGQICEGAHGLSISSLGVESHSSCGLG